MKTAIIKNVLKVVSGYDLRKASKELVALEKAYPDSHFELLAKAIKYPNKPGEKSLPYSDREEALVAFHHLATTICNAKTKEMVFDVHHQSICKWAEKVKEDPTLRVPSKNTSFMADYHTHSLKEKYKQHGLYDLIKSYTP